MRDPVSGDAKIVGTTRGAVRRAAPTPLTGDRAGAGNDMPTNATTLCPQGRGAERARV